MRTLQTSEVVALWNWAVKNQSSNWGGWGDYPVTGCSYLQFDNNNLVVKFDSIVEYQGEKFKRIGWGRRIPGNEPSITFSWLYDLIPVAEKPAKEVAQSATFKHPNGNQFEISQNEYVDYKFHKLNCIFPDGNIRKDFTEKSKLFSEMMECIPNDVTLFR